MDKLFSADGAYARAMNWIWNILLISVLWVVCSLPVVTIGAASTAAYYAAAKVVRHKNGTVFAEFMGSFRANFRQSVIPTLVLCGLLAVLIMETMYLYVDPSVNTALVYVFYLMIATVLALCIYLWACLSRFFKGTIALLRMSLILVFRHLPVTIVLLALYVLLAVCIFLMPWGILLFPGITAFAETFPMERILKKYMPAPETDEDADKWYYQ